MVFFSDSTSLYIYSSFLQANSAIIAFLGIFIVYKMQSHKASIDIVKSALYNFCNNIGDAQTIINFESIKSNDKRACFSAMDKKEPSHKFYETWVHHIDRIKSLKSEITLPTIGMLIGITFSSIMLFVSSNLHAYHQSAEIVLALICISYHMLIWSYIGYKIITIVKNG